MSRSCQERSLAAAAEIIDFCRQKAIDLGVTTAIETKLGAVWDVQIERQRCGRGQFGKPRRISVRIDCRRKMQSGWIRGVARNGPLGQYRRLSAPFKPLELLNFYVQELQHHNPCVGSPSAHHSQTVAHRSWSVQDAKIDLARSLMVRARSRRL